MATLPAATVATSPTATEGDVKSFLTDQRAFLADLLGTDSANKTAALGLLGAALNSTIYKTSGYTVVSADRGKVIACNGTFTINIQAAAALGDGFVFAVWNWGAGTITLDPNLTETINGVSSVTVMTGKMALIYCSGNAFASVAGFSMSDLLALDGAGSGLDADLLDGQQGSYYAPATGGNYVAKDAGSVAVGTMQMRLYAGAGSVANGGTVAGSACQGGYFTASGGWNGNAPGDGTWRNISGVSIPTGNVGMFQRIS